jgi:hypothetical protein
MFFYLNRLLRYVYTSVMCRFLGFISSKNAVLSEELGQTHRKGRVLPCVDLGASSKDFPVFRFLRWPRRSIDFYGEGLGG